MLVRNLMIFCFLMGLFSAVCSKLVIDFHPDSRTPDFYRVFSVNGIR